MTCPKCNKDLGFSFTDTGIACNYCKEPYTELPSHIPDDAIGLSVRTSPACTADRSIMSADGTEEIAHIILDTDGAHIDVDEAMALVEIFTRHTQRFIRNKLVKRAN